MITGGFEGGQDGRRSDSVEVYDPGTGEWLTVGPVPPSTRRASSPSGDGRGGAPPQHNAGRSR